MTESINQLADIIRNTVASSLKGTFQWAIDKEQIKDEIGQARNRFVKELFDTGRLDKESLYQNLNCLKLEKRNMNECCPNVGAGKYALRARIPAILNIEGLRSIQYVKSSDSKVFGKIAPFKILTGDDNLFFGYDEFTSHVPAAFIQDEYLWILNPPSLFMKSAVMRAILENPRDLIDFGDCDFDDDSPYPVPGNIKDLITGKLINDYVRYYRMGNPDNQPAQPAQN